MTTLPSFLFSEKGKYDYRNEKGQFTKWIPKMFKMVVICNFVVESVYFGSYGIIYRKDRSELEEIKDEVRERVLEEVESYLNYDRDQFWFIPRVGTEISMVDYHEELIDTEEYFVEAI